MGVYTNDHGASGGGGGWLSSLLRPGPVAVLPVDPREPQRSPSDTWNSAMLALECYSQCDKGSAPTPGPQNISEYLKSMSQDKIFRPPVVLAQEGPPAPPAALPARSRAAEELQRSPSGTWNSAMLALECYSQCDKVQPQQPPPPPRRPPSFRSAVRPSAASPDIASYDMLSSLYAGI
eukprot:SAG31_NODE_266_length_18815_cov_17.009243_15_plen_178_part_00